MFETLMYNLKHNRSSTMRTATAAFLFGIIILVFVFWGTQRNNQGMGQGSFVATVNDVSISPAQFAEMMERIRRDPRGGEQNRYDGEAGRQKLQQTALRQLIDGEVMRQATDREKIWASDKEVAQTIFDIPAFQDKGKFKGELYRGYLQATRKSPSEFEDELREEAAFRRTFRLFGAALAPMALASEKEKALSNMKANLEFVTFSTETLVPPSLVAAADVKSFLAKPESEAALKTYYDTHKQEFSTPEEAKVRHILLRAVAGDSDAEAKALTKIEEIAMRAKSEDFGKLASELSEDPGSKAKHGEIDYFPRGRMVPEFDQVAFSAPVKEISKPIKTQYGYHLIQVIDRKPANDRALNDVKNEIAQKLLAQERSKSAIAALEESLKKGDTVAAQKFASENKLKWAETGPFSIESEFVPKIGPNDEVVRSAFSMTAAKPLYPALVKQGPSAFVLRYKPVAATVEKNEMASLMQEMMANRRGSDSIELWRNALIKSAKITTNSQVLAHGAQSTNVPDEDY